MSKTYRIVGLYGTEWRHLPSLEAAKERCVADAEEFAMSGGDPPPVMTFQESCEDEDGEPMRPYVRVLKDVYWQWSIFEEWHPELGTGMRLAELGSAAVDAVDYLEAVDAGFQQPAWPAWAHLLAWNLGIASLLCAAAREAER